MQNITESFVRIISYLFLIPKIGEKMAMFEKFELCKQPETFHWIFSVNMQNFEESGLSLVNGNAADYKTLFIFVVAKILWEGYKI